ncbi:uncharacterized protein LOC129942219 [Eupeodes corollae]|uniref:uncharacterized protein LOC129942219 n=1 Tax=Eupeodes corollae TaxID=290404 RepID=UPI002491BA21|nr:uncharacterized protein LOC129942219 [Eupeodes corollae]
MQNSKKLSTKLYVDDGLVFSSSINILNNLMQYLKIDYKVKEFEASYFLGLHIISSESKLIINQKQYCKRVLRNFNMESSSPVSTPADPNIKFETTKEEKKLTFPFREAIGSLMYLAVASQRILLMR